MEERTRPLGAVNAASHKQILAVVCLFVHEDDGAVDALCDARLRRALSGDGRGRRAVCGRERHSMLQG